MSSPARKMEFIGVSTARSSIMKLFPRWAEVLGLGSARLVGRDLPLDAKPGDYRRAVEEIRADELSLGALVTTHKIRLLEAARDLFDELDYYARLCGEVSCISKRGGRLVGHAKDPVTAGRTLEGMLAPGHFGRTGGEALCFGAGGAGTAISVYLMTRPDPADRPGRIVMVDKDAGRLEALKKVNAGLDPGAARVEYVRSSGPQENDRLLAELPPGSLVINATGMGKDTPGSPITGRGRFPERGIVWELNYRGELDFLRQARARQRELNLTVEDGWEYFLHGWSEHIAEVFHIRISPEKFRRLSAEAIAAR